MGMISNSKFRLYDVTGSFAGHQELGSQTKLNHFFHFFQTVEKNNTFLWRCDPKYRQVYFPPIFVHRCIPLYPLHASVSSWKSWTRETFLKLVRGRCIGCLSRNNRFCMLCYLCSPFSCFLVLVGICLSWCIAAWKKNQWCYIIDEKINMQNYCL